jgi:hypothetical protein
MGAVRPICNLFEGFKMPPNSPAVRTDTGPVLPALRSRVSNHHDLLPGVKGTSSAARRFRDLVSAYLVDMGGVDRCSEIKIGLVRRLAATTVQAELLEARMINGEEVDINTLCTLASTTVRISQRLGLERVARDVSPTLSNFLREDRRQQEEEVL